jgi:hypothetical protein
MKWLPAFLAGFWIATSSAFAADPVDYLRDIRPILSQHCYSCHGPQKQKSGLRLDTVAAACKGGNSGPAIVPGKSGESLLIKAVTTSDENLPRMPFQKPPLSSGDIALLKTWIDQGAKAPANEHPSPSPLPDAGRGQGERLANEKTKHWAFRPLSRPAEPAVKNVAWVRNPIDRFVLARLEKEGSSPSPEADRITLIRRLSLDLLGLPPSIAEVDAFLADTRPDAYERLVDRLLQSPHYGERWGRHWLDLARYADSNGFNIDAPRSMWRYRDWVIDAFNADLSFDQFAIEQIAGDLLPNATLSQKIASGFHRNTLINEEGGIDLEQFRVESIVDRVNTTGAVFLGLTIGCAQCHDHKFDPISQREYYQLFAFFNNADEPTLELPTPEQQRRRSQIRARIEELKQSVRDIDNTSEAKRLEWERSLTATARAKLPPVVNGILDVPEHQRDAQQLQTIRAAYRFADQTRNLVGGLGQPLPFLGTAHLRTALVRFSVEKQIAELKKSEPTIVTTLVMKERKPPRPTYVHLGGDFLRKGARVAPDVPAVLPPLQAKGSQPTRLDLARWLVDPKNPLTPRVTMNRFWEHYFGLGLAETENDFGTQGSRPTHPELLDWLAMEFIAQKWSMKAMHRLIVTSATYRQSSRHRPELSSIDPRNQLLARQARLRLEAEIVRDVALSASGLLSPKIGGPSVFPPQPDGVFRLTQIQREWRASDGPDRYRRGMYTHFWRSAPHPALTVFDAPEATTACTHRNRSNTPLQALTLLNDQAFFEFAKGLALRVLANPLTSAVNKAAEDSERIRYGFRLCLARPPSDFERERLSVLLDQQRADFQLNSNDGLRLISTGLPPETNAVEVAAWTAVVRAFLNLDEFITRE